MKKNASLSRKKRSKSGASKNPMVRKKHGLFVRVTSFFLLLMMLSISTLMLMGDTYKADTVVLSGKKYDSDTLLGFSLNAKDRVQQSFDNVKNRIVHKASLFSKTLHFFRASDAPVTESSPLHFDIVGEFRFVAKTEIRSLLEREGSDVYLDVDIHQIKALIEQLPWIEYASVERQWPDTIKIVLQEQTPIARWENKGFVSRSGSFIRVQNRDELKHLPLLSGDVSQSEALFSMYVAIRSLFNDTSLVVDQLFMDKQHHWEIRFTDVAINAVGPRRFFSVLLGKDNLQKKLTQFKYAYDAKIRLQPRDPDIIDMRYLHGFAVSWREASGDTEVKSVGRLASLKRAQKSLGVQTEDDS